jgi:hypothetical protein
MKIANPYNLTSTLVLILDLALGAIADKDATGNPPSLRRSETEDQVQLFSHKRRSGRVYDWWLAESRTVGLPVWNVEQKEEPPLPLLRAIEIARAAGEKWERLESVAILSIPGAEFEPPFGRVFYYKCVFRVETFDRRVCVVLMDGTILEPVIAPRTKPFPGDHAQ